MESTTASSNVTDVNQNSTEYPIKCAVYSFFVQTILIGSVCVLGLIGNIISFIVFHSDKIKTSTSFLFQGLACIDSILLIASFPLYSVLAIGQVHTIPNYKQLYSIFVMFFYPIALFAQTATVWVTVLVAFNRFIAVCKPYQASRLCTVVQARKQLAIVVLLALLFNAPRFAEYKLTIVDGRTEANYTSLAMNNTYHLVYAVICYMIFLLIIPLSVLTLLNIRLIRALKEIKRRRAEMQSLRQQQDNNITFVLIIVVLVFTVCQAPALATQIFWLVLDQSQRECGGFQFYYSKISNMLVLINSASNFLIYFFFNTRFRQVLQQNLCGRQYEKVRTTASNTVETTVPMAKQAVTVNRDIEVANGKDPEKGPAQTAEDNIDSNKV